MSKHSDSAKTVSLLNIILIIVTCSIPAYAKYSGGSGDPNDPYQIANVADLLTLAEDINDYNKCFIMTADINLADYTFTSAVIAPDINNDLSTDFDGNAFIGVFDGNEHQVLNLTIDNNSGSYIGFFGAISDGEIKNLSLNNVNITTRYFTTFYVGGLAGTATGSITNCSATVTINVLGPIFYCGGLIGLNESNLTNCSSHCNFTSEYTINVIGGLTGGSNHCTINNCFSTGNMTGSVWWSGGLTGNCHSCDINNSYSIYNIPRGSSLSGGLAGLVSDSNISNCYSSGSVAGEYRVGGLAGHHRSGKISNSYSTSVVSGVDNSTEIGGLIGYNEDGNVINSYSRGSVTGSDNSNYIGGLIGYSYDGNICNSYSASDIFTEGSPAYLGGMIGQSEIDIISSSYFLNTAGPNNGYGTPLTDAQMKQQASFVEWDFIDIWEIWEGMDYPKFIGAKYSGGSGTADVPYRIATVADLLSLAADANDYNKCFIMTADIDLDPNLPGGQVFTKAVIASGAYDLNDGFIGTAFAGIFDGNEHQISNMTINANENYIGLFGYASGCEIKNLHLRNIRINTGTPPNYCGGLAGLFKNGVINNCSSSGTITGSSWGFSAGGLVGCNSSGNIINCSSSCDISGEDYSMGLGGLTGVNHGIISNCSSNGTITGGPDSCFLGGLAGLSAGDINNSFSTSNVSGGNRSYSLGGLIGDQSGNLMHNTGHVTNCFSTGNVTGEDYSHELGGLVGYNYEGNISNSYSTGDVVAGDDSMNLGGLVGENFVSDINNSYSTGTVCGGNNSRYIGGLIGINAIGDMANVMKCYSTGLVTNGDSSQDIGGLIGSSDSNITICYFLNTAGPNNNYGTPLTDAQMKQQASFIGWDFIGGTTDGPNDTWTICEGFDYPKLAWRFGGKYPLVISRCTVKSGTTDYISISGRMSVTADDFDEANNSSDTNFVEVTISSEDMDPCVLTFPINSTTWKNGCFNYHGTINGIKKSFKYDVRTHKFTLSASHIDLTGLDCPLTIEINVGSYMGTAEIEDSIVNNRRPIPIKLLNGVKNSLRVDKSKFTRDKNTGNITKVAIRGGFSVENLNDANMADNPFYMTFELQDFTIPAGSFRAYKNGFKSSQANLTEGGIASAVFDFNKGKFSLTIKNTIITAESGSQGFTMEFGAFSENTEVVLP